MMGKQQKLEPKLFYHNISLEQRVPQNHPLRTVAQLVDFDFIRSEVAESYGVKGHESVCPTVILKLMFLMFFENVKSERALASQLPCRLDWLWFCGYDLDETTPNHSVISKARRRWKREVFNKFFENILQQCINAGLVDGTIIHIDSTMIDANASKDKLQVQLNLISDEFYQELEDDDQQLAKRFTPVDKDARLGSKYNKTTLGYKDHRTVDDKCGIITSTTTTAANVNDEKVFIEAVEKHQDNTNIKTEIAVADKAYGIGENYEYLYENNITPCISHKKYKGKQGADFTSDKFTYDNATDTYICPAGYHLSRIQTRKNNEVIYRIERLTCEQCPNFTECVTGAKLGRQIQRGKYHEYYEWADNCLSKYQRKRLMARRKAKAEGSFADAANNHGIKRARWRGQEKVEIQNLMIAATQNLRKLIRYISRKPAQTGLAAAQNPHLEINYKIFTLIWTLKSFFKPKSERIFTF